MGREHDVAAAISMLAAATPLTEDQAATALGYARRAGIIAVDAYPTIRALALAGALRIPSVK